MFGFNFYQNKKPCVERVNISDKVLFVATV